MTTLKEARTEFHNRLCERLLVFATTDKGRHATNADSDNTASKIIANNLAEALGAGDGRRLPAQTAGNEFENVTALFLANCFKQIPHLLTGQWVAEREKSRNPLVIARFSQYAHLASVFDATKNWPELAAILGRDYSVASDVIVYRERLSDDQINLTEHFVESDKIGVDHLRSVSGEQPYLHASISCKWTMRSDRAQNTRTEALDLIRKRKGRVPHIIAVTAEPLPSRLSSLCLGTGDLDCVYHIALPELVSSVEALNQSEALDLLKLMIQSERIKDIADLPLDLIL